MTDRNVFKQRMANRFEVDQRAALFSNYSKRRDQEQERYAHHSEAMMEQENDRYIEDLEGKVSTLKELGHAIKDQVRESNTILDGLSGSFDKVGAMMGTTMKKLGEMVKSKSGRHMWYMAGFVVFMFFLMWMLYGRSGRVAHSVAPGQMSVPDVDGINNQVPQT
ncbi:unnamed protein product [Vitrella brassicaformis CCMP3155]|uniref:t-SNARE coiled-coil homology domain-containing protein n=1 Tax=Vitrella brassicaformis (strain CCMP3155) TaxID=1169540 RepID=A0A0G4EXM7_VITBC|nr:unnamed protein product [Vitrella brassicaformis CCMP3155]|mmetsp:Transcript_18168/g.43746  ORF Transcript_18168/g.43746 Transcript_18168/m.43746 type:complete len:164 (-) Transcript_18168:326-817(-)|eukprot:CEM03578.1 unnamed protein product [Vitrella brassicaformis CCMP3155]